MTDTPVWETAGFEYDDGDPTVGIQSGWMHWCTAGVVIDDDPSIDISEGWAFLHYVGGGVNRYAVGDRSLVCNECGANISWIDREWDPDTADYGD